ncbi:MAG: hypothetical protein ACYTFY_08765 [Planctomycetota bacterium]
MRVKNCFISGLEEITKLLKEIKELNLDIYRYPVGTDFVPREYIYNKPNEWERELGKLKKEDWVNKVFDQNVLTADNDGLVEE